VQDLLLLIHRIPYPPNKGDKIRSYHLLKHLAKHYRVHLATFVDDPDDWQYVPHVEALCASSHFARMNPLLARVKSLQALVKNRSLSLEYYRDAGLDAWVKRTMAAHGIERVLVFSSAMAQYADPYRKARRVVDFVDVDSDKWRQYADKKAFPMSLLYRYEAHQLLRYERQVARDYDASLFVSAPEAALFRTLAPESGAKIGHFSNGVDTDYFSPHEPHASPYAPGERALVFTGAMDYWPNVDAVQWFCDEVFPALRTRFPELHFYIVGSRPAPAVQALAQRPGVKVTGTVPDVRPYIAHAAVAVAPLRIARGIQNKVLEAMAMATPVVVSPQALEGIDAVPGSELVLAEDAAAFADAVATLLSENDATKESAAAAIGQAARAKVQRRYSWSSNLACIGENLECS
jgi:sugar transferase (PEP-CTERM/EpsH1 system associated)